MKTLLLAVVLGLLSGCAVTDFADKQAGWNQSHGMGSMSGMPSVGGPSAGEREAADKEAETQRNIKQGEDVENEEARKAGLGPSPTEGPNCVTTGSSVIGVNAGSSVSHTECH